ncbi:histidinol-phosphate transaminase [Spelaeicoccus albus]|uniref:Histidinol-phosphate aminotransferase n=1 Tax=Spelaeicoccus albus TaxID=1280376 RepID=A0A7Z0IHG0_9MICO|nr:histidinol-phosphate transaminase [Spelaeicoccus albus]NYI67537.1 histidinol-phosphate aminotransferase [Spelaeicoccus albus]
MSVRIRADLEGIPGYVPGRTIPGAIKLASNESGVGPLPSVAKALESAGELINRYPDNNATSLTGKLAAKFGVDPRNVVVGCGSVMLCQELIQAVCTAEQRVAFGWRSFEAYPLLARTIGAEPVMVPNTASHALDLRSLAEAINADAESVGLVFVCTPNNPTGTTLGADEIEEFVAAVPSHVTVVLDEAYREFAVDGSPDGTRFLTDAHGNPRDNVVVLRTFSKAYGLAGLRVGYAIGHPRLLDAVRAVHVPFTVNSLALAAAEASLDAEAELAERVADVVAERGRVIDELRAAGIEVVDSQANFVWLPLGDDTPRFDEFMTERKVIVRAFAADGARVTISTPADNDAFLSAAREWAAAERA